ncbi:MAG: CBS domain-containing protein [Myxococcales bacterium]|nr:CBS domain-containing protein [Myxococcales bacterium]
MKPAIPTLLHAMTPFPYFIDVHAGIAEAKSMMAEHDIRHLPVVEGRKLIGVVSDRDLKRAQTPERGAQPDEELSVGDAMLADDVYMVDVSEPLDAVLQHMWEHRLGSTLVLKEAKLVGVLTASDACRLFAAYLRDGARNPDDDVA